MNAITAWRRRAQIPHRGGTSGTPRTYKGLFSAYTQALRDRNLPEEDIRVLNKIIPDLLFDLQNAGEAFEDTGWPTVVGAECTERRREKCLRSMWATRSGLEVLDESKIAFLVDFWPTTRVSRADTADKTRTRASISPRSILLCAIWDCISTSSSSIRPYGEDRRAGDVSKNGSRIAEAFSAQPDRNDFYKCGCIKPPLHCYSTIHGSF